MEKKLKVFRIIGIVMFVVTVVCAMYIIIGSCVVLYDDYIDYKIEKINVRNAQQNEEIAIPLVKIEPIKESDIKIPNGCKTRLRMVATPEEFLRYFNSLTRYDTDYEVVITVKNAKRDTTRVEWTIYYKSLERQPTN